MDDHDAKTPRPFVHWLIYNIPPTSRASTQGSRPPLSSTSPGGGAPGSNGRKSIGYFGPRPPQGDHTHHYQITVYALDQALKLEPGVDEDKLLGAMKGHVVGQGKLVGTVQRK